MKRYWLLALWVVTIVLSAPAQAQPGTVKEIVPGVWFREGERDIAQSNNVIIEMKDYLIVVDANYPTGARRVIEAAKRLSPKPIKYVIDSHADPDHFYGNVIFTRVGATTVAHAAALDDIRRNEPKAWNHSSKARKDVGELNLPAPEPPKMTFQDSPYVISDSTRRVELYHFGFGHTRADTFVYLPKERIVCTGDAAVNGPYNDPKHSNMGNWPNEIRGALKLNPQYVLPGHGVPGGKEVLEGQIRFFEALYAAVKHAIQEGKTLDQVVTLKDGAPVATSISLSKDLMEKYVFHGDNLQPWQATRFPTQVRNTYEEIKQGKPWGIIADGV
jgi:glyoxylase-like metal-dependent hydrolase (beta-lactamase superfamily II)